MFLHVTGVSPIEAYRLRVEFSDGVIKEVDLSGELYGEVFEPLSGALPACSPSSTGASAACFQHIAQDPIQGI